MPSLTESPVPVQCNIGGLTGNPDFIAVERQLLRIIPRGGCSTSWLLPIKPCSMKPNMILRKGLANYDF